MFHVKTVDFVSYVVATDGVTMNEKKVQTIKAWKPPTSVREVLIFMGFANFYRGFIKKFSDICTPITNLTRGDKTKFVWGKDQQEAFEYLKRCFTTAPILCHFDPDRDTVVETDASDYALGCILSQFSGKKIAPHHLPLPQTKFGRTKLRYSRQRTSRHSRCLFGMETLPSRD